jgi:hypothetical protein
MSKNLLSLIALFFVVLVKAQVSTATLNITNTSLSNSITCNNPSVTLNASVAGYTGSVTYTWVSASASYSGSSVAITTSGNYTVTAFNTANSFSVTQLYAVGLNTTVPTSTVSPTSQTIACGPGAVVTLTSIVTNTNTNYTHCWFAAGSSAPVCNTGAIALFTAGAPGITTVVVTNPTNGCTTTKTVNIATSVGVPTFTVTSTTNFSLGCAPTKNTTTLNFVNATTSPFPGAPVSYTVLPPGFSGPYSVTSASTSTVITIPGTYTVVLKDQTNACESRVNVSITQNTVAPSSVISVNNNAVNSLALNCFTPNVIAIGSSTVPSATIVWVIPSGTTIPQSSISIAVTSNTATTNLGTYSLNVLDPNNGCVSIKPFPVTQSIQPPVAFISNNSNPNVITCYGTAVALLNSSTPGPAGGFAASVSWVGPSPQVTVGAVSFYNAFVAGVYSLTVQNSNNGCTATATLLVGSNLTPPIFTTSATFTALCSNPTVNIYPSFITPTLNVSYTWTPPPTATVSGINSFSLTTNAPGVYNITAQNLINGCVSSNTIGVAQCVGINELIWNTNSIISFPNPTQDILYLKMDQIEENLNASIYNQLGQLIKEEKINVIDNKAQLNTQTLKNGTYYLFIRNGETIVGAKHLVILR